MLVVRDLASGYGRRRVLRNISFQLEGGQSVALFGPNGAGKTTLLRALAGLHRASSGQVLYFGEASNARALGPDVRRRIGYLGHRLLLYPHLTGRENLEFTASLYDLPDGPARVEAMLAAVRLADAADRPVRDYSRGMAQRVGLARAFLHEPDLLLLDEPFTGLDPEMAELLLGLLLAHGARGGTLLMASHDLERALQACSRGLVLGSGELVMDRDLEGMDAHDLDRDYLRRRAGAEQREA